MQKKKVKKKLNKFTVIAKSQCTVLNVHTDHFS